MKNNIHLSPYKSKAEGQHPITIRLKYDDYEDNKFKH